MEGLLSTRPTPSSLDLAQSQGASLGGPLAPTVSFIQRACKAANQITNLCIFHISNQITLEGAGKEFEN